MQLLGKKTYQQEGSQGPYCISTDDKTGPQKGQTCPAISLYHRLKLEFPIKATQSFTLCVVLKVTYEHDMVLVLRFVTT